MIKIGLIREGKIPPDTRVALTPAQCADIATLFPHTFTIVVQPSANRCFPDAEYQAAGVLLRQDLNDCDVLMGIKEVPVMDLLPNKTYFFFSHTKKLQAHNQALMQALIAQKITLVDYEALTYDDGQRILGFGFFAGVVGAHNGLMAYGRKTRQFNLIPAHDCMDMREMMQQYRNVKLPPVKIAVTGSGRVTAGLLEIMHHWDVESVEPEDFLAKDFTYPVYTLLKGPTLYAHKETGRYSRDDFHAHPQKYVCLFEPFTRAADILMNGVYWDKNLPRLFEPEALRHPRYRMNVIADVTCDANGSVPINLGAATIEHPVYGIDKHTWTKTEAYKNAADTVDVMAVDNLPNELPRDASHHFGEHIIKYILPELMKSQSTILTRATICSAGRLTEAFNYMADYAYQN
ncbi:MAG: NAD(P)-dependent oxidoreductase [Edaphocola sp.]